MGYHISPGLPEEDLERWLAEALQKYGPYKHGGVDFSHADIAPVVMCVVACGDEILLLKRGYGLADANGYWSIVSGFIDFPRPVREIAQTELHEELNIEYSADKILVGASYTLENSAETRSYIVFPCLARLSEKPAIKLDREHTEFAWITRNQLSEYHILADLPHAIDQALSLE